ncbi:TPA_asm: hypothetical protein, partial [ssRNA phage Esthiorhiza.2_36]
LAGDLLVPLESYQWAPILTYRVLLAVLDPLEN